MESVAVKPAPEPITVAPKHEVDTEPLPLNTLFEKQDVTTKPTAFDAFLNNMTCRPLTNCYRRDLSSKPAEIPKHLHTDNIFVEIGHHQDNDEDEQSHFLDFSFFPTGHFAPEFDKAHEAFPILPEDLLPQPPMSSTDTSKNVFPYICVPDSSKENTKSSIHHSSMESLLNFVPAVAESESSNLTLSSNADKSNDQSKDDPIKEKKSGATVHDRFKPFHEEKWNLRYKELQDFVKEHGHGAVPHTYPKNPQLARWVKRQRRQYKLHENGKISTMTAERLDILNSVGIVWDLHDVAWREKFDALKAYRRLCGDCNVPYNYEDKKLATWVKCQRRQYKLYWQGKTSAMCPERIFELEEQGFEWEKRVNLSEADNEDHELLQQKISDF